MLLSIGEIAKRCSCSVQSLRHYQNLDLLQPSGYSAGGHRLYDDDALQRAHFIRSARGMGFSLATIGEMLVLSEAPSADCQEIDAHARAQLAKVEGRIEELHRLRIGLKRLIESCAGGRIADCRIIETLADVDSSPQARDLTL